jgi:predicted mannosyl-3-phosphoglycerate phosphatase (HAD superfamily)
MSTATARDYGDSRATDAGILVIFTRVEGLLGHRVTKAGETTRRALDALVLGRVPLVLVSDSNAADVRGLQRELGLVQPFICRGGGSLHIPAAYFSQTAEPDAGSWEVFNFDPPDRAAAIRLLSALFVARGHDKILSVGLGSESGDATMLAAVDVPIVVRDQHRDQQPLLQYVPGAYVTSATGEAGWLEAVIGPVL